MTAADEAPTIAERYSVAVSTSDMRVKADRKGQADVVAASGFAKGPGAIFARCRAEFDLAHAELRGKTSAIDARLLACTKMPSLKAGKAAALEMAASREWGLSVAVIIELSWQSLSGWLDPNCGHCEGRGFTGGYDGPQIICTHCRGSGKRRGRLGKVEAERRLVDWLIVQIECAVAAHSAQTSRALRTEA